MKNRIVVLLLALAFALGACIGLGGCKKDVVPPLVEPEKYEKYDYTAKHESANNVVNFYSTDSKLDSFLNDYKERHMRYSDNRIHRHPVGAGGTAWKDWEALTGNWWDSSSTFNNTLPSAFATKDLMASWLKAPKMDRQGYVWQDKSTIPGDWGMGWAFPDYRTTGSPSVGYEFEDNTDITGSKAWTSPSGAALSIKNVSVDTSGTVKALAARASATTALELLSPAISVSAFYAPFILLKWDYSNFGTQNSLDDLYIYFTTESEPTFSEDKAVKYSEYCTTGSKLETNVKYNFSYFAMNQHPKWGSDKSNKITQIKIVLKSKNALQFSGELNVDAVRLNYDDRQTNNVANYITAAKEMLSYSQDTAMLKEIMPKVRMATQHMLTYLGGANGLITTKAYQGHDGSGEVMVGQGIGNGYWDMLAFPDKNIYSNLSWYRAAKSALYLEQMCKFYEVQAEMPAVLNADMKTYTTYAQTVQSLSTLVSKVKTDFNDYFWHTERGRYIGGWYGGSKGNKYSLMDNGSLMFNLEAVETGLTSDAQKEQIMTWLLGERVIAGDNSTGADIYKYEFSSRVNTKGNVGDYMWAMSGGRFDEGVHNGGAVLQGTYYDIAARSEGRGANSAFEQVKNIQKWYEKVQAAGGKGETFYRTYYNTTNIAVQGNGDSGSVGVDYEFLEAALMISSIPRAFFGLEANYNSTLTVKPTLPKGLDYWKMENCTFKDNYYDVSIGKYFVNISGLRSKIGEISEIGNSFIDVNFVKPGFDFVVKVDGEIKEFTQENGLVSITVPFKACKVEIVGLD